MKTKSIILLMAMFISLLAGCGGSSDSSSSQSTSALTQAYVDYPDLSMQIAPSFFMDAANTQSCVLTPEPSGSILIPTGCLQLGYETSFCQLNSEHGVTLQSTQCLANISYIKSQSGTGNFDLTAKPILNNPLGVTGVLFQKVNYSSTVLLPSGSQTFNVSGGLLLPDGITGDKVKGVITYFHATAFNKSKVGSNYIDNNETRLVAEVFASQGYIVAIPDYIGQGDDWRNVHPYVLYPQVSNKTAVDMLTAIETTIRTKYGASLASSLKLFSAGYSEGGAYSAWLPKYLQDNPLPSGSLYEFKHAVGMEGAYATSAVMKDYLFGNVAKTLISNPYHVEWQVLPNISKPLLSADAFLSYATYELNSVMDTVFNMDFYNLKCPTGLPPPLNQDPICNATGWTTNIKEAFAQEKASPTAAVLIGSMGKSANGAIYPNYTDILNSHTNSVNALVSPTLITTGQTQLDTVLLNAQVNLSTFTNKPVSIFSLDKDSVVTPNNYDWLLASYPNQIHNHIKISADALQVVSPLSYHVPGYASPIYINVDHVQGLVYTFLYALNTFNQF